jgi:cullin 1
MTDAEVDRQLHSCMTVFAHLLDKDMYADLHRSHLAKRLLAKRSVSDDAEKLIVGLMKMQCGAQFTSKLEGMLHDYHSAVTAQSEYDTALKQWQASQPGEIRQIAFTNTLLTSSHWPTQRPRAYALPPEMRALQLHYAEWYKTKYSVRSLQWAANLGEVGVAMVLKGREFELTVALLQAVVLRCFHQQRAALSFEEIRAQSGVDDEEVLKRVLHSLACQKFKILVKGNESKSLTQDSYRANNAFSNKLRKFRVPMAAIDESEQVGGSYIITSVPRTDFHCVA